jgi:voltage-gated potassium channel
LTSGPHTHAGRPAPSARRRLFDILEVTRYGDRTAQAVEALIILLILGNALSVVLETVPSLAIYQGWFRLIEHFVLAFFTLEYVARVWVCVERLELRGLPPWRARLRYMLSPYALIDLAAILPFLLEPFLGAAPEFLALLRLLRLFKLARYSTALTSLGRVLRSEARPLAAAAFVMMIVIFFSAMLVYFAERSAQPEAFSSIPATMWWAIATLTSTGYGDIVPVTPLGKILGGLTMTLGLVFYALPVGIVASGFTAELHRQDFVVRWEMVARVPLFEGLDVSAIARLARLLRTRVVRRGDWICRAGEPSEGLYLIADGRASAQGNRRQDMLLPGDFFGERALLNQSPHEISVMAVTGCRLLMLDRAAFLDLLHDQPGVKARVLHSFAARLDAIGESAEVAQEVMDRALHAHRPVSWSAAS